MSDTNSLLSFSTKFVHLQDVDDKGNTRTVSVNPASVEVLFQGFDSHKKTGIVVNGWVEWVALPLAQVEAKLGIKSS